MSLDATTNTDAILLRQRFRAAAAAGRAFDLWAELRSLRAANKRERALGERCRLERWAAGER